MVVKGNPEMAEGRDPNEGEKTEGTSGPAVREPYEKPAVAWQDVLETRPGLMAGFDQQNTPEHACDTSLSGWHGRSPPPPPRLAGDRAQRRRDRPAPGQGPQLETP